MTTKAKKSLVFAELITDLPLDNHEHTSKELLPNEYMFLIDSLDP